MLFFVLYENNAAARTFDPAVVKRAIAYKGKLARQGTIVLAGPFTPRKGTATKAAGGVAIFSARNEWEARLFVEAEPLVAAGYQSYRLQPWKAVHGDAQVKTALAPYARNGRRPVVR